MRWVGGWRFPRGSARARRFARCRGGTLSAGAQLFRAQLPAELLSEPETTEKTPRELPPATAGAEAAHR